MSEFELIPRHLGIILDGNGRWAKAKGLKRTEGHKAGSENVIDITRACDELGIEVLSVYAFSTENWKRDKEEVSSIMNLLNVFIDNNLEELNANNVRLNIMGDKDGLPLTNRLSVNYALNKTKKNTGLILNIGLNYGGRKELVRAFNNIHEKLNKNIISKIDENTIYDNLYTSNFPELDLLIRTGGEYRISNFMLYQLAYTELYFTKVLWPDFNRKELLKAIDDFNNRNRRFGGIND